MNDFLTQPREAGSTEAQRLRNELRTINGRIKASLTAGRGLRREDSQRWARYTGLLNAEYRASA